MLGVDCQIHAPNESGQADLSDLAIRQEQWTFRIDSKLMLVKEKDSSQEGN